MNRPAPFLQLLIPIILCSLLAGCAGLGVPLERPTVQLADIQIEDVKTMETAFLVQLRVINPNETLLQVEGLNCELEMDGRRFATGITGEPRQVPAYGSSLIPVHVYATVFDMVSSAIGLLQSAGAPATSAKPIGYRLTGTIRLDNRGLPDSIPFETTGLLTLDGLRENR